MNTYELAIILFDGTSIRHIVYTSTPTKAIIRGLQRIDKRLISQVENVEWFMWEGDNRA